MQVRDKCNLKKRQDSFTFPNHLLMSNFTCRQCPLCRIRPLQGRVWTASLESDHPSPHACIQPKIPHLFKGFHHFRRLHNVSQISSSAEETKAGKGQAQGTRTGSTRHPSWHNKHCILGRFIAAKKEFRAAWRATAHGSCPMLQLHTWIYCCWKCPRQSITKLTPCIQTAKGKFKFL